MTFRDAELQGEEIPEPRGVSGVTFAPVLPALGLQQAPECAFSSIPCVLGWPAAPLKLLFPQLPDPGEMKEAFPSGGSCGGSTTAQQRWLQPQQPSRFSVNEATSLLLLILESPQPATESKHGVVSLPITAPVSQAVFVCWKVSVPRSEPGSSVNRESSPALWSQRVLGRQEAWSWALSWLRDLGVVPHTPLPPLSVPPFAKGCGGAPLHPGEAASL